MSMLITAKLCENTGVKPSIQMWRTGLSVLAVALVSFGASAQSTNHTAEASKPAERAISAESSSLGFSESAFRIVSDRNIFNANRSGGTVSSPRSTRSTRVESFALVGTMAYEKGAYAFFEGSGSELTKVLKPDGVIAGHKLMDIYANAVKLEYDGKEIEMPVGCQMRREDQGSWHMTEASSGGGSTVASSERSSSNSYSSSNGNGYRSDRDRRSRGDSRSSRDYGSSRGDTRRDSSETRSASPPASTSTSNESESDILKRLQERREKDSQ